MQERTLNHHETDIWTLTEPVLKKNGYRLVDVVLTKQDGQEHLTIYVFAHENMSVEDMAKISETLDGVLDGVEFLDDYMLEISSPGINRVFKHKNEFDIFKGLEVKVLTADGEKFIGECGGTDGENVILQNVEIEDGKKDIVINLANISKAKLFG